MAGLRPGFGLGGTIHSFVVMETLGMAWGGGVGPGLMTDAIDILLMGRLGGAPAGDGEDFGYGFIERGGGPFAVLGLGLMARGGGAAEVAGEK